MTKRETWDKLIKFFRSWAFTAATGRVVIHASVEKAVAGGERKQEKEQQKLFVVLGVSPSRPHWDYTEPFLDHGRVFPALTSTSEMVYSFQLQVSEEDSPF